MSAKRNDLWYFSRCGFYSRASFIGAGTVDKVMLCLCFSDNHDTLICGNCKEMFHNLSDIIDHKKHYCKLRFTCKCAPKISGSENDGRDSGMIIMPPRAKPRDHPLTTLEYLINEYTRLDIIAFFFRKSNFSAIFSATSLA